MYAPKPHNQTRKPDVGDPATFTPNQLRAFRAGVAEARIDGLVYNTNSELGGFTGAGAEPAPVVPPVYADVADYYAAGWYAEQGVMSDEAAAEYRRRNPAPDPSANAPANPPVNVTVNTPPAQPAPSSRSWLWTGGLLFGAFAGGWYLGQKRLRTREARRGFGE